MIRRGNAQTVSLPSVLFRGRLEACFQTAATAYRKTPFIFHFQETAMNRIYKVIWNSETEQ
ncbi:hypothetical protein [Neisseria bacilliformis]|uniref:hypothetical protein n=1 Tax=Neisseria bacilliformis TaxID=267212 RepID=UPI0028E4466D|nr:hypothetical protein [Neisseria bacilliformis]